MTPQALALRILTQQLPRFSATFHFRFSPLDLKFVRSLAALPNVDLEWAIDFCSRFPPMRFFFLAALTAYLLAAVCAILLFTTKRTGYGRSVLAFAFAAFVAHTVSLAGRWWLRGFDVLFQLHTELSVVAWMLTLFYFVAHRRWKAQAMGSFILPSVALLMLAATAFPDNGAEAEMLLTAEAAAWLFPVHTLMVLVAYAAFFVVFAASVMYLLQERELKTKPSVASSIACLRSQPLSRSAHSRSPLAG
jgi:ABC-type uncharacterized transport system permease subunit